MTQEVFKMAAVTVSTLNISLYKRELGVNVITIYNEKTNLSVNINTPFILTKTMLRCQQSYINPNEDQGVIGVEVQSGGVSYI